MNACAMDMIGDELKSNNIEIDRETLSFHIDACLREHDKDNLPNSCLASKKITCRIVCVIFTKRCVPITLAD